MATPDIWLVVSRVGAKAWVKYHRWHEPDVSVYLTIKAKIKGIPQPHPYHPPLSGNRRRENHTSLFVDLLEQLRGSSFDVANATLRANILLDCSSASFISHLSLLHTKWPILQYETRNDCKEDYWPCSLCLYTLSSATRHNNNIQTWF